MLLGRSAETEEIEPKDGWAQYRIVPNSEKMTITITPKE